MCVYMCVYVCVYMCVYGYECDSYSNFAHTIISLLFIACHSHASHVRSGRSYLIKCSLNLHSLVRNLLIKYRIPFFKMNHI